MCPQLQNLPFVTVALPPGKEAFPAEDVEDSTLKPLGAEASGDGAESSVQGSLVNKKAFVYLIAQSGRPHFAFISNLHPSPPFLLPYLPRYRPFRGARGRSLCI